MNVAELRALLDGFEDDAEICTEVTLEDGTPVVGANLKSVERGWTEVLESEYATLHLVTTRNEIITSEALASVAPEALELIAKHGEPLPGGWPDDCD